MTTIWTLETIVGDEILTTSYRVLPNQTVIVVDERDEPMPVEDAREHARARIGLADAYTWTEFTVRDLPTRTIRRRQDRHFRRRAARLVALDNKLDEVTP